MTAQEEHDALVAKALEECESRSTFIVEFDGTVKEVIARRRPTSEYWNVPDTGSCLEAELHNTKLSAIQAAIEQQEANLERLIKTLTKLRSQL